MAVDGAKIGLRFERTRTAKYTVDRGWRGLPVLARGLPVTREEDVIHVLEGVGLNALDDGDLIAGPRALTKPADTMRPL